MVLIAAAVGIIYTIVTKFILAGDNPLAGILLAAFVVFAALALTYVILGESINEKKQKLNPQLLVPDAERPVTMPPLQEGRFQPAASIVEDTTDLLPVETRTQKLK